MLQYKIPQNVGIEDKIVGPFSLRQLIIVAVGMGTSYVLFAIGNRLYELNVFEYIIIVLPALFALAAALIRINNVSFTKYLLLTLEFAIKPKKRYWDHRGISFFPAEVLADKKTAEKKEQQADKKEDNVNLHRLSSLLDSGGFENVRAPSYEDIDKAEDEDLITEAFFGHKKKQSPTENMYWRTREMQKKKLEILANMPKKPAEAAPKVNEESGLKLVSGNEKKEEPAPQQSEAAPAAKPDGNHQPKQAQATPVSEKDQGNQSKPSVVENLAKVIRDANERKKNNDKQSKSAPEPDKQKQTFAQKTEPPQKQESAQKTEEPKKQKSTQKSEESQKQAGNQKKKRKRKRKPQSPARPDASINTTENRPAVQPSQSIPQPKRNTASGKTYENEFDLNELQGGEIEINLD
jgi:hypothetical protein